MNETKLEGKETVGLVISNREAVCVVQMAPQPPHSGLVSSPTKWAR